MYITLTPFVSLIIEALWKTPMKVLSILHPLFTHVSLLLSLLHCHHTLSCSLFSLLSYYKGVTQLRARAIQRTSFLPSRSPLLSLLLPLSLLTSSGFPASLLPSSPLRIHLPPPFPRSLSFHSQSHPLCRIFEPLQGDGWRWRAFGAYADNINFWCQLIGPSIQQKKASAKPYDRKVESLDGEGEGGCNRGEMERKSVREEVKQKAI